MLRVSARITGLRQIYNADVRITGSPGFGSLYYKIAGWAYGRRKAILPLKSTVIQPAKVATNTG